MKENSRDGENIERFWPEAEFLDIIGTKVLKVFSRNKDRNCSKEQRQNLAGQTLVLNIQRTCS
jgi:hypothetical protein